jgi:predicted phage terminase large subunit-like protein
VVDPHKGWAKGTQEFAERFRHFSQKTPWFHTIWYDAYDNLDITQLYVQGPREHAKCLGGDSLVLMEGGDRRRIDSLVSGDTVLGLGGPTRVVDVRSQGVQPVYRIETRRGRRITANSEHRFLTWGGWKRVEELARGDRIAAPRRYDLTGQQEPDAEVKLAAYLIGDGCLVGRKSVFTNTNERLRAEFEEAAGEAGLTTRQYDAVNVNLLLGQTGWTRAWGINDKGSATKRVPDRIFRADQATQALFLNRLFACDGHATTAGNGIIGYASKSRDLIDGVAHLLLRLGIACLIQRNDTGRFGVQWRLAIGTREDCERFVAVVGIFGKEEALARLLEHLAKRGPSNDRIDLIPTEWRRDVGHGEKWFKNRGLRMGGHSPTTPRKVLAAAEIVGNAELRRKVEELTWLEITSIEPAGEAEVWDIETESHTFVANDIVTHNSSTVWTYALRRLCENHHLRIGIISGNDELAKKFLNEVKNELESNEELSKVYNEGRPFKSGRARWTEHEIVLADARKGPGAISGKDVSIFAIGRGGQISSRHCDLLIADDVESAETVKSEVVRNSTAQWWAREVIPVLSPGGKFIVVGTRKSHVDLYSRLIDDPTWTTIKDAASVWREGIIPEEPIWPEMWQKAALLVRKATLDKSDVLAWSQEYLNKPLPSSTQMFHPESWPQYVDEPHSMAMREDISVLQYWDLAISEKTTADFTVGICAGVDNDNNMYLLEVRRGHWGFNTTLAEIGSMGASYPRVAMVGIEEVAYQAAAVQEAARRTMLPILPVKIDKDKVTRARLVEARANVGKVFRPAPRLNAEGQIADVDWWADFATECSFFPDPGSHDDQPDALSGVAKMAGWSADSIGFAYGVWTCVSCAHMFVFEAGRPCPKCGTKAPDKFDNPEVESMGGMLEDGYTEMGIQVLDAPPAQEPKPVAPPPSAPPGPATANVHEVEVVLAGDDPVQIEALRITVEQMGETLFERDGRYFVATKRYGFMRNSLIQQPYVTSVI